jgi:hypothetical protein
MSGGDCEIGFRGSGLLTLAKSSPVAGFLLSAASLREERIHFPPT